MTDPINAEMFKSGPNFWKPPQHNFVSFLFFSMNREDQRFCFSKISDGGFYVPEPCRKADPSGGRPCFHFRDVAG